MFISNAIKVVGCLLMLFGANPLLLVRHRRPRRRRLLAGQVRHPHRAAAELAAGQGQRLDRGADDPVDHPRRRCSAASCSATSCRASCSPSTCRSSTPASRRRRRRRSRSSSRIYVIAALFNLRIPRTEAPLQPLPASIGFLVRDFSNCNARLWSDKLGQISLATTTLFWGVSGNLRVHRLRLGRGRPRLHDEGRLVAGRRRRHRHRPRRGARVDADAPRPGDARDPARHRAWACS